MQEIDVGQLMMRVRENVRKRTAGENSRSPESAVSAFDSGHAAADGADLDALHDIRAVSLTSHRRMLGPLIIAVKKTLQKLLTPILERQVAYNAAAVRAIGALHRQLRQENLVFRELLAAQAQVVVEARSRAREALLGAQLQLREELLAAMMAAQSRLHDELATQSRALQAVRQSSEAARERISQSERKLRRLLYALQIDQPLDARPATTAGGATSVLPLPELGPEFDYAGFGERFRGSEEDIKARQRSYVQDFEGRENVLDIGCGRGEFLELLRESGIKARGVDLDLDMILLCRDKGLDVVMDDALAYLGAVPDDSIGGVFAAQVIEHLYPRRVIELVKLCHRKLAPGGALVLETPNPKCLMVFADSFYRDPSHLQPIHPDTMQFLFEATGFHEVEIRFSARVDVSMRIPLLEVPGVDLERFNQGIEQLNSLLFGFLDYAVVGRKSLAGTRHSIAPPQSGS